jgi:hypothetical protein
MLGRLVSRIDPIALQLSFIRWMQEGVKLSEGKVVAVNAKRLRSLYNRHDSHCRLTQLARNQRRPYPR